MLANSEISPCWSNSSKTEHLQSKSTSFCGSYQVDVYLNSGKTVTLESKFQIPHHRPRETQQVQFNQTIFQCSTQWLFRVQWTRKTIQICVPSWLTKQQQSASCPAQSISGRSISQKISTRSAQSKFEGTQNSRKSATFWTRSGV